MLLRIQKFAKRKVKGFREGNHKEDFSRRRDISISDFGWIFQWPSFWKYNLLISRLSDSQEVTYNYHGPGRKRVHRGYPIRRNQGKYLFQKNLRALFHGCLSRRTCFLELPKQQLCDDGFRWYRIGLEHQLEASLKEQGGEEEEGPGRAGEEEGEIEGKGSYTERNHWATVKRRPAYHTTK